MKLCEDNVTFAITNARTKGIVYIEGENKITGIIGKSLVKVS